MLVVQSASFACSAFQFVTPNGVLVAKSYDWLPYHGHGAVFINPRGMRREALGPKKSKNPACWTSALGSVTFTQFGQGLPIGGVNEKGLVVEMLQLNATRFNSHRQDLPFVNEAQWTQFQLDQYGSVQEVLRNLENLRVDPLFIGIHYFVADSSGDVAVIEFLDGKAVPYHGADLPVRALTNSTYQKLLAHSALHAGAPLPATSFQKTSEERFRSLAELLVSEEGDSMDKANKLLDSVRADGRARDFWFASSQWNLIYNFMNREVTFRSRNSPSNKILRLDRIDWAATKQVKVLDMDRPLTGYVDDEFAPITEVFARQLNDRNRLIFAGKPGLRERAMDMGRKEGDCARELLE